MPLHWPNRAVTMDRIPQHGHPYMSALRRVMAESVSDLSYIADKSISHLIDYSGYDILLVLASVQPDALGGDIVVEDLYSR